MKQLNEKILEGRRRGQRHDIVTDGLFSVEGKVVLVTGGSSGIGLMISEGLARSGARVLIAGRDITRLAAAVDSISAVGDCCGVAADVATAAGRAAIADALATNGRLDVLVNNAGTTFAAPIDMLPPERFDRVLQVNLGAPFALVGALLPLLLAAAADDAPARIINISSIDAFQVPAWESYPYSASKAGLRHLTRHLAKTLAPKRITVNSIAPGLFPSNMTRFLFDPDHPRHEAPMTIPLGRPGEAADIVGAVIYLASRAGAYCTGIEIPVSGGVATAE